jgi:hypothetical protein
MALPSEQRVSLAIRSARRCGRGTASSRSSPGYAGSGGLFVFAQVLSGHLLRENGQSILQQQKHDRDESGEYEKALHEFFPAPYPFPAPCICCERHLHSLALYCAS